MLTGSEVVFNSGEDVNQMFGRNHKSNLYGNVFIEVELSDYSWEECCNKKEVLCTTQWR